MDQQTGKYVIIAGGIIVLAGLIIYFLGDKLNWIGRLPGDIRVEKGHTKFYFPVTTMLVFSLVLTLIIQLIRRLF